MGVLDRFEKGIERAVNGAFAKAFRSEVEPVEIASALRREVDDHAAIVARDRTLAPNTFVVELGQGDHERLGEWEEALSEELAGLLREHAQQQRYSFLGPISVSFEEAEDLDTGLFRVRSSSTKGAAAPGGTPPSAAAPGPAGHQPPAAAPAPAPGGYPPAPGVASPAPSTPGASGRVASGQGPSGQAPSSQARPAAAPRPPANVPPGTVAVVDVEGRSYPVSKAVTVIGRGVDADIVLDDGGVSRRHAEIHLLDGKLRLVDLGSTNGTYLDGERIHAGPVADGSTITMGRSRLTVHLGGW